MSDGIFQLGLHGHDGAGNQWANFYAYNVESTGGGNNVQTASDIINAWDATLNGLFLACCPGDIYLRLYSCRNVDFGGHSGTATGTPTTQQGTRPDNSVTLNVGPQIAFYPELDSRSVGKSFLPGIANDDVVEGTMVGALATAVDAFALQLLTALNLSGISSGGTAKFSIWKRAAHLAAEVIAYNVRRRLGSQRKRTVPVF